MNQTFLKRHQSIILMSLVAVLLIGMVFYIIYAPPVQRIDAPAEITFDREVFVRRKPSDEARPWARTKKGSRLVIVSEDGEWLEVELDARITGWVRKDQGNINPPPFAHPTPRQQAKQRIRALIDYLR